jgi:RNA polymerase sigma-70 factor (ECF subfamily)
VITWIASIARHRAIDVIRRRNIRPESRSVYWDDMRTGHMPSQEALEENIELRQRRNEVRRALRDLPEEQQSALALAFFHGYTHKEIAEIQGLPLGTVKTRIRLAMQKLRPVLTENYSIE